MCVIHTVKYVLLAGHSSIYIYIYMYSCRITQTFLFQLVNFAKTLGLSMESYPM